MAKVVLVTGGATGIGEAIVRELAQVGYDIAIAYHTSRQQAQSLLEDITSAYPIHAHIYQVDVSSEDQVKDMMTAIEEDMGGVDILINNAAIDLPNLFELKTAEEFRKVLDVNVVGAYNCASALYRHFVDNKWGRIINIASTNGMNTYYPMCFDYDASKAALISLTHNLALQYAPYVNVNAIAPGFIGTKHELEGYDEDFLKEECDKILVKRYGEPEEVAHLVKFLISDEAKYINNTVIRIDGGQMGSY